MPHRLVTLAAAGALTVAVAAATPAFAAAPDKDCGDFPSQAAAQTYFVAAGGSLINNVDQLDNDHDGQACDSYAYVVVGGTGASAPPSNEPTSEPTPVPTTEGPEPTTTPSSPEPTETTGSNTEINSLGADNGFCPTPVTVVVVDPLADDGSTANVSGNQISVVPEGSAQTGAL